MVFFARSDTPNLTGATSTFAVPFPYLSKAHIHFYFIPEGSTFEDGGVEVTAGITWLSEGTVSIVPAPEGGTLSIRRDTPRDKPVSRFGTGTIASSLLNTNFVQLLYIGQEATDAAVDQQGRTLVAPLGEVLRSLPDAAERANKFLGFSADGSTPLALSGMGGADAALRGDLANGTSAGIQLIGYGMKSLDKATPRSLSFFGVDPFTILDQSAALQTALSSGLPVFGHPEARYRKDGPLYAYASRFDGQGATFVALSNGSNSLIMSGAGGSLRNLTSLGAAVDRSSDDAGQGGLYCTATDFLMEKVFLGSVDNAESRGFGAAGATFYGAQRGTIRDLWSAFSRADSTHVTGGSRDLTFDRPRSYRGGDDGFSVVSYVNQGLICSRIHTNDLITREARARGVTIVGGNNVHHQRPRIYNSSGAAVLVQSEGTDSFDTYGVEDWSIQNLYAEGCGTQVNRPGLRQPLILISGRPGTALVDGNIQVPLTINDGFISGEVLGMGDAATMALSTAAGGIERLRFDLLLQNMTNPLATRVACALGGTDLHGRIFVKRCRGIPFELQPTLTGDIAFGMLGGQETHTQDNTLPAMIHSNGAQNWNSFYADLLQFRTETGTATSGITGDKFKFRQFSLNNGNVAAL